MGSAVRGRNLIINLQEIQSRTPFGYAVFNLHSFKLRISHIFKTNENKSFQVLNGDIIL